LALAACFALESAAVEALCPRLGDAGAIKSLLVGVYEPQQGILEAQTPGEDYWIETARLNPFPFFTNSDIYPSSQRAREKPS
jgi:hypothetical protein